MKKRFVVIGASAASIAFISKLRAEDPVCEIICISGESEIPYNRCFLADFLSEEISVEDMHLKPDDFFVKNGITLRLGTLVTRIDSGNNIVFIGEEQVSYDYLFLGTGTRAAIPKLAVDDSISAMFAFHTKADIDAISRFIKSYEPKKMVVVGAGLNGLECASSLHDRGISVTLIEGSSHILPTQVEGELALHIASIMQDVGVTLLLGTMVQGISAEQGVVSVMLQNGSSIQADGIVFAIGSVLNSELLIGSGIALSHGSILVNEAMQTSIPNIYAGGDICMVYDSATKTLVKSATWADAMLQGLCAATQFGSRSRNYPGYVGLRDSYFFGNEFYACGKTVGFDVQVRTVHVRTEKGIKVFYLHNEILVGFVLLGDISGIAQYKQWYMTKKTIEECLLV